MGAVAAPGVDRVRTPTLCPAGHDAPLEDGADHERTAAPRAGRFDRSGPDPGHVSDPRGLTQGPRAATGSVDDRLLHGGFHPSTHVVLRELATAAVLVEPADEDVRELAVDGGPVVGQVAGATVRDEDVAIDRQH